MKTKPSPRSGERPGSRPSGRASPRPSARERADPGPIALPGTLLVKWINGRNGEFAVGDLRTSIGEFRVKDSLLDQFDEGMYQGTFWISQIFSKSYEYRGRITIETRAVLADLQVDDEARDRMPEREQSELDPVDEPPPAPPVSVAKKPGHAVKPAPDRTRAGQLADDAELARADRDLFGDDLHDLVARHQRLKLDPTVDRLRFRQQRDRLRALGYEFDARVQTWMPREP
jgi:hypothetical protein